MTRSRVVPAIASGCPVIVKPARQTPLSCYALVGLFYEAGLPEPWCQAMAITDLDVAQSLVTDARVDLFSFIGSAAVGWKLRSLLAPGTRCALEHGGAAPLFVLDDADLDAAVPLITKGGFYHAGQVCVSVQRVFAEAGIVDQLAQRLGAAAAELAVGDPLAEETEVGPLIGPGERQRVDDWVSESVDGGGELITGGVTLGDSCYAPTVVAEAPPNCRVNRQEIFGPVISLSRFDQLAEAMRSANELPFAFQAAVFTQDVDRALGLYRAVDASAVMVNDHTAFRTDWMPFAGLRESGQGVGGIPHTLKEMQIDKLLVLRSPALAGL